MERKKLERKIVRLVRTHLKPGMSLTVGMDTRILMDVGLDSMDFMLLSDTLENDLGIRPGDAQWNAFWADSEVTVGQLCDFCENCLKNNIKRTGHGRRQKENKD